MSSPDDITLTTIEDIAPYAGPHAIEGIRFRPARQALGVSSWGMSVLELDPHCEGYPEHDHASDGHEEVYVVLSGALTLKTPHGEHRLAAGQMARVGGAVRRKLVTSDAPAVVLALGGTPGAPYVPSMGG